MPIINRLLHITNFKSPLLRTIVPSVGAALAVQFAAGLPSVLASTERFFDFSGSLTFLAVGALSLYLPHLRRRVGNAALPKLAGAFASGAWNWRQVAVTGMAMAWAARLGAYLFHRISQEGHDARFDTVRTKPLRFAFAFFMQAVWVSVMLMPVMAVNAVPAAAFAAVAPAHRYRCVGHRCLDGRHRAGDGCGCAEEQVGGGAEEEGARRAVPEDGLVWHVVSDLVEICLFPFPLGFLDSRFPHYFGEISLWTGLATTCAGVLALKPVQLALGFRTPAGIVATTALSFVAPAFSGLLVTRVSGIPLTEARHDESTAEEQIIRSGRETRQSSCRSYGRACGYV
ncbi:hypothetical protein J3459_008441 [Metarhizium acridum]|nr:hypothetical protein J3459_008441 [Metarhizium acridum]